MAESKAQDKKKVGPIKYVGQVRQEGRKVVWPTWRETMTTSILVLLPTVLMGAEGLEPPTLGFGDRCSTN